MGLTIAQIIQVCVLPLYFDLREVGPKLKMGSEGESWYMKNHINKHKYSIFGNKIGFYDIKLEYGVFSPSMLSFIKIEYEMTM